MEAPDKTTDCDGGGGGGGGDYLEEESHLIILECLLNFERLWRDAGRRGLMHRDVLCECWDAHGCV